MVETREVPAFPGAAGGGAGAVGGRGGRIMQVTNLNDSGPGSLREAVDASGPRIVVFRTNGTIELRTRLRVVNPYITIAGQTAPGGGIQVVGPRGKEGRDHSVFFIATHDVIMRYLRIRHGYNPHSKLEGTGIRMSDNAHSVVIDHCSIQWSENKSVAIWASGKGENVPHSITFSNNIFAEVLKRKPSNYAAGAATNLLTGGQIALTDRMTDIDWYRNLAMHGTHRYPLVKNKSSMWINNLVYNWNSFATMTGGGVHIDIINNIYREGPMNRPVPLWEIRAYSLAECKTCGPPGIPSIYLSGNIGPADPLGEDNWELMARQVDSERNRIVGPVPDEWRRASPRTDAPFPITVLPTASLDEHVLSRVGASARLDENGRFTPNRDAVDSRLVDEYQNGKGPTRATQPGSQEDVGGYPQLAAGTPYLDSDGDGMPDAWEIKHGFDPFDPADGPMDANGNGYTNVEEFLNGTHPVGP